MLHGHLCILAVLLADGSQAWQPPASLRPLWLRLRVAALHALWVVAGAARRSAVPHPARLVAARILYGMRKLIVRHWFRVDMRLSDLNACPHWLTARTPSLTLEKFKEWWCPAGPLCCLQDVAGAKPRLQLLWSAQEPVPLPAPPPQPLPVPPPPLPAPRRRRAVCRPAPTADLELEDESGRPDVFSVLRDEDFGGTDVYDSDDSIV